MVNKNVNTGRKLLVLKIAIAMLPIGYQPIMHAEQFFEDSKLTGGLYYWQRDRSRKDLDSNSDKYKK
ncbi:ChiP family protein, partial [Providencia rettgeri]|nr:ChiP family protein [Providencia rettgeri]